MINIDTITIIQFKSQFPQGIGGYPYFPMWSNTQPYEANDVVFFGNTFYQAILQNTDQAPPNATYWITDKANQYSYISDADITTAFLLASGLFPADIFTCDSDVLILYAYCLLVAHMISYYIKPQQFQYIGQRPASIGVANTQQAGNVGFGQLIPESVTSSILYSTLNRTLEGQQYMMLVDLRARFKMLYSFGGIPN